MTWEYQSALSDDVFRLLSREGEVAWGVVSGDRGERDPSAIDITEVDLPTGPKSLLIVPPLQGGLILDVIRSYQGLTEGELCTFFLGIIAELSECSQPQSRLSLEAFGLDGEGRPRIIPGVHRSPTRSARREVGEMLYHASCGRPWSECLLPVEIALAEASPELRALVTELLDETSPEAPLSQTLAEVGQSLRRMAAPSALPLIPADHEIDPGGALTARLRAVNGHASYRQGTGEAETGEPSRSPTTRLRAAGRTDAGHRNAADSDSSAPTRRGRQSRQHGGNRRSRRDQRGSQRSTSLRRRVVRLLPAGYQSDRADTSHPRTEQPHAGQGHSERGRPERIRHDQKRSGRSTPRQLGWRRLLPGTHASAMRRVTGGFGRICLIGAICLTLIGGLIVVLTWTRDSPAPTSSERDEASSEGTASHPAELSEDEIVGVLRDLCDRRAAALSAGDSAALAELTVPDSEAAAADELIDPGSYVGSDYTIELDGIEVDSASATAIVVTADMTAKARRGDDDSEFAIRRVSFELSSSAGEWKVSKVREVDS